MAMIINAVCGNTASYRFFEPCLHKCEHPFIWFEIMAEVSQQIFLSSMEQDAASVLIEAIPFPSVLCPADSRFAGR